ncbi:MAG: protein kinase [Gemmataceae bacterium]|nr:protein kinase [Gemmataceae bacterium]
MSAVPPNDPATPPTPPPGGHGSTTGTSDDFKLYDESGPGGGASPTAVAPPDTTVRPAAKPEAPPVGNARYALGAELGRGAMGAVHTAVDADFGREVAVKVLLDRHRGKPDLCWRFVSEARITARLQHPGIVPLYELGEFPDGRPYYVMRKVEGHTLAALLAARCRPADDRPRFLKAFEQVCQAVGYAHANGVIHRDLKPSNVMVGPFGVVKVMDWGVAKVMAHSPLADADPDALAGLGGAAAGDDGTAQTQLGRVLGTPAYMSPEQAHGLIDTLDERADVFGLGAILCAVLTGHPPYDGLTTKAVYKKAAKADLAEAHARLDGSGADPELVELCRRCLAADPAFRPRDASALAAEFTAYLERDLRRAERDQVRFFELSPDLFCIAGLDGYFRRVNANFTRVLGYSAEELTARPFVEFVHPDDRPATLAELAVLSAGDPTVRFRNRYRDAKGEYHWFEWSAKPCPVEGVVFAVARDVTDRVELERQILGLGGE